MRPVKIEISVETNFYAFSVEIFKLSLFQVTLGWVEIFVENVEGGGGGRVNIVLPQKNFKTLVYKNTIKPNKGGPPRQFFLKALTPLAILVKNIRYPLPWIFNLCASMTVKIVKIN